MARAENGQKSKIILILGGAKSGKSDYAQKLAETSGKKVAFMATAEPRDAELIKKIEAHKKTRPADWQTIEVTGSLTEAIESAPTADYYIVDCLTLHTAKLMEGFSDQEILAEINMAVSSMQNKNAVFLIVSNEVGTGIVPSTSETRRYRDLLGNVNRTMADHADEAVLLVSGLPVRLKGDELCPYCGKV